MEQRLLDAVIFCREKAELLRKTNVADIPLRNRMAHFSHIADRSGETYVEVGLDARIRIHEWCFEHLTRRDWTHLISVQQCAEHVEEAIAFRFFRSSEPINVGKVSRLISRLDKSILSDVKPHRYLWPCHICHGENPAEFWIGTVRFRPVGLSKDEIESGIASWKLPPEGNILSGIERYYATFVWMADVTVDTADKAAARRISILAVQTALTGIKLLLSDGGTESRIRVSQEQNFALERAELYFLDQEPHLSWHHESSQVPFSPTWWDDLSQGSNAMRLRALDRVVRAVTNPAEQTFLKQKYLNALRWFNDATLDTYAGSRIAKFVAVLETLTGCNEREDLSEAVSERVAFFLAGWPDDIQKKVKRVYAVRSELLHGERNPIGLELGQVATEAAKLAHNTLVSFLDLMIHIGVDRNDYNNQKLLSDFGIIKSNVLRMREDVG